MILRNKFNLPAALVTAVEASIQPPGALERIRVTELIDAPQVRVLTRAHWAEIEEDVSDRIFALFGSALHEVMRQHTHANTLTEEQLEIQVGGWTVTGHPDVYEDDGTLNDWKVTPVWPIVYAERDGEKVEWVNQLNSYAHMLREHNFPVKRGRIIAFLRDWSRPQARKDPAFPQHNTATVPATLWPAEQAQQYIAERVALHQAAAAGSVPDCTPAERWEKPTTHAVVKDGNKRAARVLSTLAEANEWAAANMRNAKWHIETRPGEQTRCVQYCRVSAWCSQWKAMQEREVMADGPAETLAE
jgi:hypothetical protein